MSQAMRFSAYAILILLSSSAAIADELQLESAAKRWAKGGPGGSPDFVRHVVPLFSKMGCNNRACHGSFQGQNGFRLSLFGFEPKKDLEDLLEDADGGPRANVDDPSKSLVLRKPAGEEDHDGGELMDSDDWQYRMFRQWIADGAKFKPVAERTIVSFEIQPKEIVATVGSGSRYTLKAIARFADGSREDVTGLTVFSSNNKAIASVNDDGQVTVDRNGDTSIVARYSGSVNSTQVLVANAHDKHAYTPALPHNEIDEFVFAKLRKLNIQPSGLCEDSDFVRRVYLDLIGMLPTADEARRFLQDRAPEKRQKLIDELLDDPNYARYWGMKFSDWTGNSKYINNKAILSNWLWQQWLEDKLARNVPYDELVYGFVCATSLEGRPRKAFLKEADTILHRAAGRYNYDDDGLYASRRTNELYWSNVERRKPETMLLQTANSFLGLRLECAQCHNHPFDRWTQQDFEQFKSIFMTVRFCDPETGEEKRGGGRGYGDETVEAGVSSRYIGSVKKFPPKFLGGKEFEYESLTSEGKNVDLRVELWNWMRSKENPYFAPSFVNRVWHHYFGMGIVDPPDDFNQGNPPSNPQLLSWLADEFVDNKYDIKHIHRLILNSRTYQASWEPNKTNRLDNRNWSHARLRRMPAEVLIDAVADVTQVPNNFGRIPATSVQRAVGQAMPSLRYGATRGGYAMKVFGRPDREKTCDCERSNEPSVAQALYLLNDEEVLGKLNDAKGIVNRMLLSGKTNEEVIAEFYLAAFSRFPTSDETRIHTLYITSAESRKEGLKDVLWSLINVREFIFIH